MLRDYRVYSGNISDIMENQAEKKMEHEMETGTIGFIGAVLGILSVTRAPAPQSPEPLASYQM